MANKEVTPEEALELMANGHVYIDVRSEREFEAGHPKGAFNVPISVPGPTGPTPNLEFAAVLERAFGKEQKLILGCQAGPRSKRAAQALTQAGFSELSEMPAGWGGSRDAFGRPQPGWSSKGLPSEQGKPEGHAYPDVIKRTR